MKKIFGIIICMLFLFSTIPIVNGTDCPNNNNENSLQKSDNNIQGFEFGMTYGRIIYNGIEYSGLYYLHNMTAINVKATYLLWSTENGLEEFNIGKVYDEGEIFYIPVGYFLFHGFIIKNYVFWCGFKLWF